MSAPKTTVSTQQIVARVDADRKAAGVTVSVLAKATGMSRSTLRRQLLGQSDFKVADIMRIGDHLEISASTWFRDLPPITPNTAGQAL